MAGEVSTSKWHGGILLDIVDREKVMAKFGKDGCSISAAMVRAIQAAVEGVRLPKSVYAEIQKEISTNHDKRMARRKLLKSGSKSVSGRKSPMHITV